ncbi:MAG: tetratricopeptide repeat protein [Rhodocyclaceae bacterium]|nr:tetratricopeptide repeat protein [Rhodocyclaceae bacterium]
MKKTRDQAAGDRDDAEFVRLARLGQIDLVKLIDKCQGLVGAARHEEAIRFYREWLFKPNVPVAHVAYFNLGVSLSAVKRYSEAESVFRQAIALRRDFFQAQISLGTQMEVQGRVADTIAQWQGALAIEGLDRPDNREMRIMLLNNLGRILEGEKRFAEAEDYLEQSLQVEPNQPKVLHHLVHLRQKRCRWPVFEPLPGITAAAMMQASSPIAVLAASDDPAWQLASAQSYVSQNIAARTRLVPRSHRYKHDRMRIGYLSSDYCLHPVSMLTVELFELHDRKRCEVYGFCWSREDGSGLRKRVIGAFDKYIQVGAMTDEQVIELIRQHEIDVLVDLHGITSGARATIIAAGPAPVQVSYLGQPGTTGLPNLDYVIVDRFVFPESLRPYFTEEPMFLPNVYQVSDRKREVLATVTRAAYGLPQDKFVYCMFNNNYKITPEFFEAWMRILRQVPDSLLWLLEDNKWAGENMRAAARAHGIDPARLVFGGRVSPQEYLGRFTLADLFLDSFPFNGGTTANDVLWAGLPLLTMSGQTFISRMAGSLLNAVGLPELVTTNLADYERRAVELGRNRMELQRMRMQLAAARTSSPLFDVPRIVRDIEDAFAGALASGRK